MSDNINFGLFEISFEQLLQDEMALELLQNIDFSSEIPMPAYQLQTGRSTIACENNIAEIENHDYQETATAVMNENVQNKEDPLPTPSISVTENSRELSPSTAVSTDDNVTNEDQSENFDHHINKADEMPIPSTSDTTINHDETDLPEQKAAKRFKSTTSEDIKRLESAAQSKATQHNTVWALKIFQDWSVEVYGHKIDMEGIQPAELSQILAKFYAEARPKESKKRNETLPPQQANEYHKNTLINIRGALNRHLQNLGRDLDLVREKTFKHANRVLEGLLKERMRNGVSRATQHKDVIPQHDLLKIAEYLSNAASCAIILRRAVWYSLSIHFVTRGLEFHNQLLLNSFIFSNDESGHYAELNHETQQKNFQGGFSKKEAPARRMYATGDKDCPVSLLRLLISKTDPSASKLFNQYIRDASYQSTLWYCNKPLANRTYSTFMSEICKAANTDSQYTAHCLRATCIKAMNDSGFEARHIMSLSGHKSEAAIRSYNRSCSTSQKKLMSNTLSKLASGAPVSQKTQRDEIENSFSSPRSKTNMLTVAACNDKNEQNMTSLNTTNSLTSQNLSNVSALMSNGAFSNCTFNIQLSKC